MTAVRTMTEHDLPRVAALSGQLGYPVALDVLRARFLRLAGRDGERLFVAEHGGRIVGWLHVGTHDSLEADPCALIAGLVVDEGARRLGVGRALVAAAEAFARARGLPRMRVRSNVQRPEAHAFYPAVGYVLEKTQHAYGKRLG